MDLKIISKMDCFVTLLFVICLSISILVRFQVQHACCSDLISTNNHPSYSSAHLFKSTPTPCSLRLTGIVFWVDLFHMQRFDLRRLPGEVDVSAWKIHREVIVLIHPHDIHHCIYHHVSLFCFLGGMLPNMIQ